MHQSENLWACVYYLQTNKQTKDLHSQIHLQSIQEKPGNLEWTQAILRDTLLQVKPTCVPQLLAPLMWFSFRLSWEKLGSATQHCKQESTNLW